MKWVNTCEKEGERLENAFEINIEVIKAGNQFYHGYSATENVICQCKKNLF